MMPRSRACGVLVVRGRPIESFLLMRHPTRWDLPKGHVEPGENDLDCALREMEEETGITAADVEIDPRFRFTTQYTVNYKRKFGGRTALKTVVIFLGRLVRDVQIETSEHEDCQWFDWNPPHAIQEQTIDSLLREVEDHVGR